MKEEIIESVKNADAEKIQELLAIEPNLINTITPSGISLILLACYYRNQEIIKQLLGYEPVLDIFEAAAVGEYDRVYDILKYTPELVNEYSPDGFTPLGLASYFGHYDIVKMLLAKGAEVNIYSKNEMQVAPIHSAVSADNLEIARLLLENKADPNLIQSHGITPLHEAAGNGSPEMVKLLLKYQADPEAHLTNGEMPEDLALKKNYSGVADMIKHYRSSYQRRG